MNNKYHMLAHRNRTLFEAKMLNEIMQFGVQRALFEKMRSRGNNSSRENASDQFKVQINSHGKLDEFKGDDNNMIQPIDEMGEIINDLSKEIEAEDIIKRSDTYERSGTLRIDPLQELFDFKSLLQ